MGQTFVYRYLKVTVHIALCQQSGKAFSGHQGTINVWYTPRKRPQAKTKARRMAGDTPQLKE